jgi:hypothetical protein
VYTLLASPVLYAIFGASRQLVVAGTSASAYRAGVQRQTTRASGRPLDFVPSRQRHG